MFVTAYYDIYGTPEQFDTYLTLFRPLGMSGLPIIVFVDPSDVDRYHEFPDSVHIIGRSLDTFELYQMAMAYKGELPAHRNETKDTKAFLALMNTKVEFLKAAKDIRNNSMNWIWIDYGIMKIMKNPTRVIEHLHDIFQTSYHKITIPGCWSYGHAFSVDSIHWRFCGGFLILPDAHLLRFYDHHRGVLTDFCTLPQYKLTWETNVWSVIEFCAERENIQWYFADHNDTIVGTKLPKGD